MLSICCENGWIDDNSLETIAEAFIRQRKAVAVFAASRDSWTYPNNDLAKYIFDAVMTGGCVSPGDIIRHRIAEQIVHDRIVQVLAGRAMVLDHFRLSAAAVSAC